MESTKRAIARSFNFYIVVFAIPGADYCKVYAVSLELAGEYMKRNAYS